MSKSYCYLVIEIHAREAVALRFLAYVLLSRRVFDVVRIIELRQFIANMKYGNLEPGVILLKSAPDYLCTTLKKARERGHRLILQNQEGVSVLPSEYQANALQVGRLSSRYLDAVISASAEEYRRLKNFQLRRLVRGRLLRLLPPITHLKATYARDILHIQNITKQTFLLFVSTMGDYLGFEDSVDRNYVSERFYDKPEFFDSVLSKEYKAWVSSQKATLFELGRLLVRCERLGIQVVIRPHPSENINIYKYLFSRFSSVIITREFNLQAWLMSAEYVICATSTAAAELKSFGKTPLILLPRVSKDTEYLERLFVNRLGPKFQDADGILSYIKSLRGNSYSYNPNVETRKAAELKLFLDEFNRLKFLTPDRLLGRFLDKIICFLILFKDRFFTRYSTYYKSKFYKFEIMEYQLDLMKCRYISSRHIEVTINNTVGNGSPPLG